ncbi:MAG TPA: aldo/keto reductase [Erysipelothrix sp.]|nr:aldo/keto reductase [Erysipelothrix sp.]
MEYVKLGNSGLDVSRICLGGMSFGDTNWIHDWVLDEEESRKIIKRALELGINFFDTANIYSYGVSEEILGRALRDYANRKDIVIATKVFQTMREGPNAGGLSRKAIFQEVEDSLTRLGVDYIDLLIIHRYDYDTPLEETMKALHDLVEMGKVHYLGASAMYGYQFQKAQYVAEKNGWTKFISMQNHYNLIYREDERELIPVCEDQNVSLTPYSPLAAGRLARAWTADTKRAQSDKTARSKYDLTQQQDTEIVKRVEEIAHKKGVKMAQVALAWLLHKPQVAAPVVGVTKMVQLEEAVEALKIKLTQEEIAYLEELYLPHKVSGAR